MGRSTKDAWLQADAGDLVTEEVSDVPVQGSSVLVRALPARYSAEVSSQMKMHQRGREQVATVDVAAMEVLQFAHGVVEPEFSEEEARQIAERFGPAFRKVIEVIDRISGIDKKAVEDAEARFPSRSGVEERTNVANGDASGSGGPAPAPRVGAGPGHDGK